MNPAVSKPLRICLVTPGHLSSTPRLVKAADALHAAGHRVRVVASNHYAPVRPLDAGILARAGWTVAQLPPPSPRQRLAERLVRFAARLCARAAAPPVDVAARMIHDRHVALRELVAAETADLYLAHTLGGLTAAAHAARKRHGRLGFDAEDWHREELAPAQCPPHERRARAVVEDILVPRCDLLTAAAPLIAARYAALWQRLPPVVLNVFPLSTAPAPVAAENRAPALFWFSQTIGPGRGIEAAIAALATLPPRWTLDLLGFIDDGYREALLRHARDLDLAADRLRFLPPCPPDALPAVAASRRIGLAIELRDPPNRDICLTNKIFTYLLAGTPVLLSRTSAHEEFVDACGPAARLIDIERPQDWSAAVAALDTDKARDTAASLGRERYNWKHEQDVLLREVANLSAAIAPLR